MHLRGCGFHPLKRRLGEQDKGADGKAGIDGVSPAVFGKYLAQHSMFLEKNGVRYSKRHTSSGSIVTLERIGDGDGNDSNDGIP